MVQLYSDSADEKQYIQIIVTFSIYCVVRKQCSEKKGPSADIIRTFTVVRTQALEVGEVWLQGEGMLTGDSEIHGDVRPGHRATF